MTNTYSSNDEGHSKSERIRSQENFVIKSEDESKHLYASAAKKSSNVDHESDKQMSDKQVSDYQMSDKQMSERQMSNRRKSEQEKFEEELKRFNDKKFKEEEVEDNSLRQYEADHETAGPLPETVSDFEQGEEFVRERIDRAFRAAFFGIGEDSRTFENIDGDQVSISSTLYVHLLHTKVFYAAFLYLQFGFVIFWQKNIIKKAVRKMFHEIDYR